MIHFLGLLFCLISLGEATTKHTTRAPTEPPPYCYVNSGCRAYDCECLTTFTYCNSDDDPAGVCEFTTAGKWALTGICVAALMALVFVLCLFCCCCRSGSGNGSSDHHITINYPSMMPYPHHELM